MSKLRLTCNIILIIVSFTMLILSFAGVELPKDRISIVKLILSFAGVELPKIVSGTAIGIEAIAVIGLVVATVKEK